MSCSYRCLLILLCLGMLAVRPCRVSCLISKRFPVKQKSHDEVRPLKAAAAASSSKTIGFEVGEEKEITRQKRRVLGGDAEESSKWEENPGSGNERPDPNQSSKRRVGRGSNPIHNRS